MKLRTLNSSRVVFVALVLFFLVGVKSQADDAPAPVAARATTEFDFHVTLQDFNWTEDVTPLTLEESGPLYGLGFAGRSRFNSGLNLHFLGQYYGGDVDYDGFLQSIDGGITPYKATTWYQGSVGHLDLSLPLVNREQFAIRPVAGLGARAWLRALDDSEGYGYDEFWLTMHARLGGWMDYTHASGAKLYASVVALLTIYNDETVENVPLATETIYLEPGKKDGLRAEAGFQQGRLSIAVFHDRLDFGQSELDESGSFFQPASEMRITGLRLGMAF